MTDAVMKKVRSALKYKGYLSGKDKLELEIKLLAKGEDDADGVRDYYRNRIFVGIKGTSERGVNFWVAKLSHKLEASYSRMVYSGSQDALARDQSYLVNHLLFNPSLFEEMVEDAGGDPKMFVFSDNARLTRGLDGKPIETPLTAAGALWLGEQIRTGNMRQLFGLYRAGAEGRSVSSTVGQGPLSWHQAEAFMATDRVCMLNVLSKDGSYPAGEIERQLAEGLRFDKYNLTLSLFTPEVVVKVFEDVSAELAAGTITEDQLTSEYFYERMYREVRS